MGQFERLTEDRMNDYLSKMFAQPSSANLDPSSMVVNPQASVNYQRTREMTIDELLLENRVAFLVGEINQASAARVMMQMLYLENQKRGQDIQLYINSPGGAVDDTLARYLQPHVALLGLCHSTESGGRANTRSARLPNAWYSQT